MQKLHAIIAHETTALVTENVYTSTGHAVSTRSVHECKSTVKLESVERH